MNGSENGVERTLPKNVGILAMDIYFPLICVNQEELETFDGVSKGKYTIGLGQTNMAFPTDREDVCSMSLTVVRSLMEKYNVSYQNIGRIEVGSESLIDKSKSVKTVIMQLFTDKGNTDIEGVDSLNACYGGTAALFNAVNWIESSSWDGRLAIVVAADIALYERGPARATGGCGAIAMLIGPDATIALEGIKGTYMEDVYDFYKPAFLPKEYPIVDGHYSIKCYMKALDHSYKAYRTRFERKMGHPFTANQADFAIFHTPFTKIVSKAYARLYFNDYLGNPSEFPNVPSSYKDLPLEETFVNAEIEKTFLNETKTKYAQRVQPSTFLSKELGNLYCGSLYSCLLSLISDQSVVKDLVGKRVLLYSYGSGLAATTFSVVIRAPVHNISEKADIHSRISKRVQLPPQEFTQILDGRELLCKDPSYTLSGSLKNVGNSTYYVEEINEKLRRRYAFKQ